MSMRLAPSFPVDTKLHDPEEEVRDSQHANPNDRDNPKGREATGNCRVYERQGDEPRTEAEYQQVKQQCTSGKSVA